MHGQPLSPSPGWIESDPPPKRGTAQPEEERYAHRAHGEHSVSYLVLARKWRPQTFEDVVGQEHVTKTLHNAILQDRVAHAYLFTGVRGVGKTTVARIFAKVLNCRGSGRKPCDACVSCREIMAGNSADVFEIDGASNTSVDDVRALKENIKYLPSHGAYKIYIIDEVHMLSNSAFNALLKTLEEPPKHVVFIFATTEPHKIPDTVPSRCQRFDFKRVPTPKIVARLEKILAAEGIAIERDGIEAIARAAEGSLRDALSILDQIIAWGAGQDPGAERLTISGDAVRAFLGEVDRQILLDLVCAILDRAPGTALQIIGRAHEAGYDFKQFSAHLVSWIRNLTVIRLVEAPRALVELDEETIRRLEERVAGVSLPTLEQMFALALAGDEQVQRSEHPRIVLEMTVVRLATLEDLVPIREILGYVRQLEQRIASPRGATGEGTPPPQPSKPALTVVPGGRAPERGGNAPDRQAAHEAPPSPPRAEGMELIERIATVAEKRRFGRLAAFLEHALIRKLEEGAIHLTCPPEYTAQLKIAWDEETAATFERIYEEAFGRKIRAKFAPPPRQNEGGGTSAPPPPKRRRPSGQRTGLHAQPQQSPPMRSRISSAPAERSQTPARERRKIDATPEGTGREEPAPPPRPAPAP
ncbi:MAG: DNA polymerase III subunit gamma/tau, partial [Deltaproteobacteria bacterium]